jgi:hypothetical protein
MLSAIKYLAGIRHTHAESERMEKLYQTSESQKKAGVATPISDKTDFKTKLVRRNKGHIH